MEWVKLAAVPAYYIDGALLRAGEAAEVLFCRGLAHCGGVESKGVIDKTVLPMLVQTRAQARADALVREGLWLDEGLHYRIRSWDKWQDHHDIAAEKKRKDRERQREYRRAKSQDVSRDSPRDVSQPLSRDSHSDNRDSHNVEGEGEGEGDKKTTTSSSSDAAPQRAARRATRIPDAFPAESDVERLTSWAREHCPAVPLKVETDQWLDYHRAKGDTAKDWTASWRTWMRNAQKYSERNGRTMGQLSLAPANRSEQRTLQNVALIEHFRQQEQGA